MRNLWSRQDKCSNQFLSDADALTSNNAPETQQNSVPASSSSSAGVDVSIDGNLYNEDGERSVSMNTIKIDEDSPPRDDIHASRHRPGLFFWRRRRSNPLYSGVSTNENVGRERGDGIDHDNFLPSSDNDAESASNINRDAFSTKTTQEHDVHDKKKGVDSTMREFPLFNFFIRRPRNTMDEDDIRDNPSFEESNVNGDPEEMIKDSAHVHQPPNGDDTLAVENQSTTNAVQLEQCKGAVGLVENEGGAVKVMDPLSFGLFRRRTNDATNLSSLDKVAKDSSDTCIHLAPVHDILMEREHTSDYNPKSQNYGANADCGSNSNSDASCDEVKYEVENESESLLPDAPPLNGDILRLWKRRHASKNPILRRFAKPSDMSSVSVVDIVENAPSPLGEGSSTKEHSSPKYFGCRNGPAHDDSFYTSTLHQPLKTAFVNDDSVPAPSSQDFASDEKMNHEPIKHQHEQNASCRKQIEDNVRIKMEAGGGCNEENLRSLELESYLQAVNPNRKEMLIMDVMTSAEKETDDLLYDMLFRDFCELDMEAQEFGVDNLGWYTSITKCEDGEDDMEVLHNSNMDIGADTQSQKTWLNVAGDVALFILAPDIYIAQTLSEVPDDQHVEYHNITTNIEDRDMNIKSSFGPREVNHNAFGWLRGLFSKNEGNGGSTINDSDLDPILD